jgi:hypothetical protein
MISITPSSVTISPQSNTTIAGCTTTITTATLITVAPACGDTSCRPRVVKSLRAIAEGLNAQGIPTARGEGEWTATQVMRVLERLDPFREEEAAA